MNINFGLVGFAIIVVLALVMFFIRRNRKDKKEFEQGENQPKLPPKRNDDERERL